ncbi:MAG: FAD-dependent oxidoreductase, partial [Candidatus Lutibacillus vidarii]
MSSAALWWDGMPAPSSVPGRAPVAADLDVDVCIVGAGFTGLWTAYYLSGLAPQWSILVLDAEHVGFGASGRNGGWVSALWPVGPATIAAESGADAARSLVAALQDTVDEVGRVCAAESLDAGFVKGGTVVAARNAAQVARAQGEVAAAARWGMGSRWLDAAAARERLGATSLLGASYS